jgi:hypothetical protein
LEQENIKPMATELEEFLGRFGRITVKESHPFGAVQARLGSVKIEGIVMYEPGGARRSGLRIEVAESGRLERSRVSFVDFEELGSLAEALAYMNRTSQDWKLNPRQIYTEVQYSSKGEFRVGFYSEGSKHGAFISSGNIGKVSAFVSLEELRELESMVGRAQSELAHIASS